MNTEKGFNFIVVKRLLTAIFIPNPTSLISIARSYGCLGEEWGSIAKGRYGPQ